MLQIGRVGAVTEFIRAGNTFIPRIKESTFCNCSLRFLPKVPSKNINQENIVIQIAFVVETCGRFRRPGFLDAPAWTNYGSFRIVILSSGFDSKDQSDFSDATRKVRNKNVSKMCSALKPERSFVQCIASRF